MLNTFKVNALLRLQITDFIFYFRSLYDFNFN